MVEARPILRRWRLALPVAGVAAVLGGWWYYRAHSAAEPAASRLRAAAVSRGSLAVTERASGTFGAAVEQKIFAPVGARIKRVAEVAAAVKKGESMVWLDDKRFAAAGGRGRKNPGNATVELEEAEVAARSQEQQAAQELAQARSELRAAEVDLDAARARSSGGSGAGGRAAQASAHGTGAERRC